MSHPAGIPLKRWLFSSFGTSQNASTQAPVLRGDGVESWEKMQLRAVGKKLEVEVTQVPPSSALKRSHGAVVLNLEEEIWRLSHLLHSVQSPLCNLFPLG
jgi:hypothetical protein